MNLVAVTVAYNDDFKLNEWLYNYDQYKDGLYMHIIVDNGSNKKFVDSLQERFKTSVILKEKKNRGTTAAYNVGIKYALENKNVDAIMLIGNDILIDKEGISGLCRYLNSNNEVGVVAPAVLSKDKITIESLGCWISKSLYLYEPQVGIRVDSIELKDPIIVETVPGGMNIAKRNFYETVGLQDEKLFMYSDEVDTGIRAKKYSKKIVVLPNIYSYHMHINKSGKKQRLPFTGFLIGRNKIYLAWKHFGFNRVLYVTMFQIAVFFRFIFKRDIGYSCMFILGVISGFLRIGIFKIK